MKREKWAFFAVVLLGVVIVACDEEKKDDPIIGGWAADEETGGETTEMEVRSDLEGDAKIWGFYDGDLLYFNYDLSVENNGNGEYKFELDSLDDSAFDFNMDCEINSDGDELDCEGEEIWQNFSWTFEKE